MSDERLLQWLEAERDGKADEAETLFSALMVDRIPILTPPPGFTGSVVAAILSARSVRPWERLSVRLLGASAAVLMGLVLLAVLALDPLAVVRAVAGGGAAAAADLRAVLHACLAMAWGGWSVAATLGRTMLVAVSSGVAPLVLLANVLLALASSYGLARLMAPREECP